MTENEELCLLVGFHFENLHPTMQVYLPPQVKREDATLENILCQNELPDFFHDLNALDKWVVPVLRERGVLFITVGFNPRGDVSCYLHRRAGDGGEFADGPTEAAALASAALKFLKER